MALRKVAYSTLLLLQSYAFAASRRRITPLDLTQWHRNENAHGDDLLTSLLGVSDPDSSTYGQHWSARQVMERFKPAQKSKLSTLDWIRSAGIEDSQIVPSADGGYLDFQATVDQAARLLNTTFQTYTNSDTGEKQITSEDYYVPGDLFDHVAYVVATSPYSGSTPIRRNFKRQTTNVSNPPGAIYNCSQYTTPLCLRKQYGIPPKMVGSANGTFGIYEQAWQNWLASDLDTFFQYFAPELVGKRPKMELIDGGYSQTDIPNVNFFKEANLDFQYAMALTSPQTVTNMQVGDMVRITEEVYRHLPLGHLNLMLAALDRYYCDSLDPDIDPPYPDDQPGGYNHSADCGTVRPPDVLSISYTFPEAAFPPEYLHRQCLEYLKLGLMGITVVVSVSDFGVGSPPGSDDATAGHCLDKDTGAFNTTTGSFSPSFPSSCPWVTTVGGSQLYTQSNTGVDLEPTDKNIVCANSVHISQNETAWYHIMSDGSVVSGGGGFSNVFPVPTYQREKVSWYKKAEIAHLSTIDESFNATGRGYPDVSVQAEAYLTMINGQMKALRGSSASAPVFASIVALLNAERANAGKSRLGFLNPALYANDGILNDVVTGGNEGCDVDPAFKATCGWDAVTGLGSPDYARMRKFFLDLP
ncbi:peptidase S8/S53 domain-containing protein [Lophiotrema nucula]|uniref:Peptidase S8/S53 domain-containing protein n=1 Tax=Lophiotrema nucula TaxID=690887 RepID=A0A6A5Z1E3_9PLEO|nr:peptidase S8/S53 domain-containing protein [Lophiotrema nucula]